MITERFCDGCDQGWWADTDGPCPRCNYLLQIDDVETFPGEDELYFIEITALTANLEQATNFFLRYCVEEYCRGYPTIFIADEPFHHWEGPLWLKPGIEPFIAESGELILCLPGDPAGKPFWVVRLDIMRSLSRLQQSWDAICP
jgi:hypothetical protein